MLVQNIYLHQCYMRIAKRDIPIGFYSLVNGCIHSPIDNLRLYAFRPVRVYIDDVLRPSPAFYPQLLKEISRFLEAHGARLWTIYFGKKRWYPPLFSRYKLFRSLSLGLATGLLFYGSLHWYANHTLRIALNEMSIHRHNHALRPPIVKTVPDGPSYSHYKDVLDFFLRLPVSYTTLVIGPNTLSIDARLNTHSLREFQSAFRQLPSSIGINGSSSFSRSSTQDELVWKVNGKLSNAMIQDRSDNIQK